MYLNKKGTFFLNYSRSKRARAGPIRAHAGPYGPIWSHMDPYGPENQKKLYKNTMNADTYFATDPSVG